MKQTRILSLVIATAVAAIVSYLIIRLAVSMGFQVPVANLNLILVLPIIGLIVLGLTWPIIKYRRATKALKNSATGASADVLGAKRPKRVDPFYAVRVLMLAKASAIAGSLFVGWHLGAVAVQAQAPVTTAAIWLNFSGLIGSLIMTICGIVAERICRIPDAGSGEAAGPDTSPITSTEATPA